MKTEADGHFSSPNYPNLYPNDIPVAEYLLHANAHQLVVVVFTDFGLEGVDQIGTCRYDYVRVSKESYRGCAYDIDCHIPDLKIPVIWLVKRAAMILTVPAKIIVPGAQIIGIECLLCSSRQHHIDAHVTVFVWLLCRNHKLQQPLSFQDNHLVKIPRKNSVKMSTFN